MHNFSLVCEKTNPCQNGGTCLTLRSLQGYKCNCPKILDGIFKGIPSHTGLNCQHQVFAKTSTDKVPSPPLPTLAPTLAPTVDYDEYNSDELEYTEKSSPATVVNGPISGSVEQGNKIHYENIVAILKCRFCKFELKSSETQIS